MTPRGHCSGRLRSPHTVPRLKPPILRFLCVCVFHSSWGDFNLKINPFLFLFVGVCVSCVCDGVCVPALKLVRVVCDWECILCGACIAFTLDFFLLLLLLLLLFSSGISSNFIAIYFQMDLIRIIRVCPVFSSGSLQCYLTSPPSFSILSLFLSSSSTLLLSC